VSTAARIAQDIFNLKTWPLKCRIRVRQLGAEVSKWTNTIKDLKTSGTSHIIVDVETKYMNEFIRQVTIPHPNPLSLSHPNLPFRL